MDKTETWIKMCDKARKFLPKWIPQEGDPFCCRGQTYIYQDLYLGSENNEDCFPLYRQDQLQEMVHPSDCTYDISYVMLDNFIRWYQSQAYNSLVGIYSMEQLWLAFVMKEKYNKLWNGEAWNDCH